jgi:hypothetical protein
MRQMRHSPDNARHAAVHQPSAPASKSHPSVLCCAAVVTPHGTPARSAQPRALLTGRPGGKRVPAVQHAVHPRKATLPGRTHSAAAAADEEHTSVLTWLARERHDKQQAEEFLAAIPGEGNLLVDSHDNDSDSQREEEFTYQINGMYLSEPDTCYTAWFTGD